MFVHLTISLVIDLSFGRKRIIFGPRHLATERCLIKTVIASVIQKLHQINVCDHDFIVTSMSAIY